MPVRVVYFLEVVDVAQDYRQRARIAAGAFDFLWQPVHQVAAVECASERIGDRQQMVLPVSRAQRLLQPQNAPAGIEPRDQFAVVNGLGEIVVGAGLQTFDDAGLAVARREQDRIDVAFELALAHGLAQVHAIHLRHFPVGDHSNT